MNNTQIDLFQGDHVKISWIQFWDENRLHLTLIFGLYMPGIIKQIANNGIGAKDPTFHHLGNLILFRSLLFSLTFYPPLLSS
jgi:hypothetical protein